MSRSANFFAQSFAAATPAPTASTSKLSQPICLSTLLKPSTTLSDLSSRLDEAVAALSQSTEDSSFSSDGSDSYDEDYWEAHYEEVSTPSSSVSSITPTQQLKPALRSTPSTGSNGRKASFSEEPPKVARTYSASEYPRSVFPWHLSCHVLTCVSCVCRAGPQPRKLNYISYLETLEQKEANELVEDKEKEEQEQEQDAGLTLCRFPSSKRGQEA